jgi:hypothetical protein
MPFVSEAQRAYFHAHLPALAKEWEAKTRKGVKLPRHVKAKPKRKAKR